MVKKYFKENLRMLILPAVALLVISFLVSANYILLSYRSPIKVQGLREGDLFDSFLCLITPIVLTVVSFSFTKNRSKLDFYDALPIPRKLFFIIRMGAVFVMSCAVFMVPFVFSAVTVIHAGVPITALNVVSELLSAIRYTAIATGVSAISVVAFRKPFMTFVGAFEMIFVISSYFSTMLTLINRKLPSFGLYDESPAINLSHFPDTYTLFNNEQVLLSVLFVSVQIILSVAAVYLCAVIYKKTDPDTKMSPVLFYLCLFLPCMLAGVTWNTTLGGDLGYIVIAILSIICFVPVVVKYKSLKRLIQSVIVCGIVIGITYLLMYEVPEMYSDYNNKSTVYANEVKNVEIIQSYSQFLEAGMKSEDSDIILEFIEGITDNVSTGATTIIKLDIGKPLPIYRYARYETDAESELHDALVGAEHIIEYLKAANNNITEYIWFDYDGPTNVRVSRAACNSFIEMLSGMPKQVWYDVRNNQNLVKMRYGQNSYHLSVHGYDYSLSPVAFPEFFDIINEQIDESEFKSALETGEYIGKYQMAGYRFKKELTDEVKTIIADALTRDISDMVSTLGEEEFAKGGVWAIETLPINQYDVIDQGVITQELKSYHLLPLTESECETLISFFKQK